jgi:hypothetical protein
VVGLLFSSCYHQQTDTSDAWIVTEEQMDSISFYTTHHYTHNYNFLVTADTLWLIVQQPSEVLSDMLVDSVAVVQGDRLVVADIMTLSSDTIDSVWVQVARDQLTMGWTREQAMLPGVAPDNPISQFITFFSDTHLLIILAFLVVVVAFYTIRLLRRHHAKIVHFDDIPSAYPTLLAILVAVSAVFYSTIQLADPDSWRHYYYHPTLNPFSVPLHLSLFLISVWAMLLIAVAAIDDIRRHLTLSDTILYCLGLMGVCAIDYVVFSISTLYYVGYPLLVLYVVFAAWRYIRCSRAVFICGHCGAGMRQKGVCPKCGSLNV